MGNILAAQRSDLGTAHCVKESFPLTWTEVVRGVLVQILAQFMSSGDWKKSLRDALAASLEAMLNAVSCR